MPATAVRPPGSPGAGAIAVFDQPLYPDKSTAAGPLWPSGNLAAVTDTGSCSPPFMAEVATALGERYEPAKPELQTHRTRGALTCHRPFTAHTKITKTKPSPRLSADSAWPTCAPATRLPTRRAT